MSAHVLDVVGLRADTEASCLLTGLDLTLDAGEVLVVLGESGAGKSTLGLALLGEATGGVRLGGRVRVAGRDLLGLDEPARRRARAGRVGYLPQHPGAVLDPVRRVGAVLRELAALVHTDRRVRTDAVAAACEAARLDPALLRRHPHQLSGGQQQRAALAQTLVTNPALLVLDEPTTGLDPDTATELVERLAGLLAEGMAIVLLTHDHPVVRTLGGRALVLERGRVTRRGTVADVVGAAPAPASPQSAGEQRIPRLRVRGMRIADTSGREVLRGIDLDAEAGELLALVGPSGAGKTTLGRCLAGLAAGRGTVTVNGELLPAAVSMRSVAQRRAVQYVHQDPRATFLDHRSVLDQVARPAVLLRGEDQESARAVAAQLLEDLGLGPATWARRATTLSGGQLQRAAVARALAAQPAVLVCDEVTSALDGDRKQELLHALDRVQNDHATTVVLISHDLPLVAQVSDRVAMIEDGRLRWTRRR